MELGSNIAKIRKENALTQEAFAAKYNVTQQTISNWENGRSYPDLETLIQISDDFGVSLDVLMKGDREMVKEFSAKIRNEKYYKIIAAVLAAVFVIGGGFLGLRYAKYMSVKNRMESKFYEGVASNGFVSNESEYDCRYHLETDGVIYEVRAPSMKSFDFDPVYWDLHGKYVTADFDPDKKVSVKSDEGAETELPYKLEISFTKDYCSIYAKHDESGEIIANGYIYYEESGRQDEFPQIMRQIYADNEETIEKVIEKLTALWNDIYYQN